METEEVPLTPEGSDYKRPIEVRVSIMYDTDPTASKWIIIGGEPIKEMAQRNAINTHATITDNYPTTYISIYGSTVSSCPT